ncbi:MAG: HEAT repeat domain-containing protein [Ktedonobacteraceae bacterium]
MSFYDPSVKEYPESPNLVLSEQTSLRGETPPQILAQQAAEGRRGAAWRLLLWVIENNPRAMLAVSSTQDARLAQHLLEFIALGTWAGKPFTVPIALRSPYTRTRLCTLFVPSAGIDEAMSEKVLLPALHDARPAVRETAMHLLGIMGSKAAVPELIAALHDPASDIRQQAIKALGRSGDPVAVSALLNVLPDSDEQQGNHIFQALVNLGHSTVPSLLEASYSHSTWVRWHSIRALSEIHDGRALPRLVHALTDTDHGVVWMAAKGLTAFGRACIEPVLRLLTTTEMTPWLAETTAYILSRHYPGYEELQPYLNPVIQQMQHAVYRDGTCYTALKALNQLQMSGLLL